MTDEDLTTSAASSAADTTQPDTPDAPDLVSPEPGAADASAGDMEAGEGAGEEEEAVPFHEHPRWQQLQRERAELKQRVAEFEPFADIVQGFKDAGYTDAQAVRAAIDSQAQEAQAQEAAQSEERWRAETAQALLARASDPDDDMTMGEAEALFRAAQLQRDLTRRDQSGQSARNEAAASALGTRYPDMDAETVRDLLDAGLTGKAEAAARRTHEARVRAREKDIADYNAKRAAQPRAPEGGGGGARGPRRVADMTDEEFLAYDREQTQAALRRA